MRSLMTVTTIVLAVLIASCGEAQAQEPYQRGLELVDQGEWEVRDRRVRHGDCT